MALSEWDNSCRLCAEEQTEMFSIFDEEGLRRKVAHKLRVCLPVMVYKTDPLPKMICQFCAARLDDAYEFREYCLTVYKSMHIKLLTLQDLKAVQIYMDAMNNSPDPCQVQLCKEKARAPPPLVPLPASLPLIKRAVIDKPKVLPHNVIPDLLPELPCEVEIKEVPGDSVLQSNLDPEQSRSNHCQSLIRNCREHKTEGANENDVIVLDDVLTEDETSDNEDEKKEEKQTSILEQVLTGNLTIDNCKELSPKTKLTSQWWCSPCNSYYRTKSSLIKHMQRFCPRTYTCSKCSLVFHTVQELAKHEASNHLKVTFDFEESLKECHQCDREFVSWEMLRNHRLRDHIAESMEIGTNTWCPLCNRFFPTVELYCSHKQLHDTGALIPEATTQTKSIPKVQEEINDTKREHFIESVKSLTCPTCGKVCTQQSALSNHMRTHEPKKHKCEICGRSFGLFIRLAAHRLSEHGQQPIMSPITASVEQEEALNAAREAREARVARTQKSRNRTFPEIVDDGDISIEDQPVTKNSTHPSANAAKNVARCGICQQWFTDHTTMLTHLQNHSDTLAAKSFSCRVCKKTFKEKWQMSRHEVSHKRGKTGNTCKTCKKTFTDKNQLKAHESIHTVNKTYHCPKCNKIFFKEFSLMTHQCTGIPVFCKRNSTSVKIARKTSSASSGSGKKRKTSKDQGALNNSKSRNRSRISDEERDESQNDANLVELDIDEMPKLNRESLEGSSIPILEPKVEIEEDESAPTPVKRTLIRTAGGYRCGVCQSPFVLRELAVAHLRSAHPMMPYQCPYCKKRFTTQYTFTHHIKTDHPDETEK